MPRVGQAVNVEVSDKGVEAQRRKLELMIDAPSALFTLPDLLVHENAIKGLDYVLKISARRAVSDYIGSGRKFVKKSSARKKATAGRDKN